MICAWEDFLKLVPPRLRKMTDSLGRQELWELRLRLGAPPEMVFDTGSRWGTGAVSREELAYCVNAASRYSPWAAATAAQGYITAPGGHRVGLCGEAVCQEGKVLGIGEVSSLCLRVARDFPGIGRGWTAARGSTLILAPPGWGKTTLLRDICRQIGEKETVCVIDQRRELFPRGFSRGKRVDVLSGCPKGAGMEMALRTMTPQWIAVDEITAREDVRALIQAAFCGVRLLATAHGREGADLYRRGIYRQLVEKKIFDSLLILGRDKSWRWERMDSWAMNCLEHP